MAYTFKHGDRPVDGYTIQRAVGRGGFGEVYYAVSDGGREVAVKYLRDNPQVELRGVSHCINLKSPHLVSIFDVKKTRDGDYAIIMEYCSGPSLRDLLIAEPNGFPPQKAAFFVREIAKGLAYLHDRGIVHRDLKPGNIFFDDGYVKIGDYGLSKFISVSRHSVQTASVGTVHYMAPEIGSGNYSRGIDIYALGVMLYEMLLGKVPFEGSTMAEVLMKHLTVQPELDKLPQPFGRVIRKALEKDPNDRYQNVDEMVSEILDVAEVRESLAGFHPKSLEGAVRGAGGRGYDSPVPSPNPAPMFSPAAQDGQPPFAIPVEELHAMSQRAAKRMKRISRKFDAKMAKLQGKREGRRPAPPPPAPQVTPRVPQAHVRQPGVPGDRKKRLLLSALFSMALAVGLGIAVGNSVDHHHDEWGGAAGVLAIAMSGAILLARGAINWFGVAYGPSWCRRMIQLCCAMPLLALGASPLLGSSGDVWNSGMALWLGLVAVAVFCDWERTLENSAGGEIRFSTAIWRAFCALVATAICAGIFEASPEEYAMFAAAGVAGVATLIVQTTGWWLTARADRAMEKLGTARGYEAPQREQVGQPPPPPSADLGEAPTVTRVDAPNSDLGDAAPSARRTASRHPDGRWGVTRAFWGLVAFALMGGTIVAFLFSLIANDIHYHDRTGIIIALTGFFSFMIFALRKTTPLRRPGFWRDSLRPFLMSVMLFAMGGTITGIAREWDHYEEYTHAIKRDAPTLIAHSESGNNSLEAAIQAAFGRQRVSCLGDEGRVGLVAGLVMSSIALIGLTLFTGGKSRKIRPFLKTDDKGTFVIGAMAESARGDGGGAVRSEG